MTLEMSAPFAPSYGPWALVAGASEGIGGSFAHLIAARGVSVVLVARRADPLEATASDLRSAYGVEARTLVLDLTSPDVGERVAAATDDLEIGLLVYNAGATHGAERFHDAPVDAAMNLVRLNCVGPVTLCHHLGARMLERGRGGIILLSSVSSVSGSPWTATYSATKAFDVNFAEGLWAEMGPKGVDVLALIAGATSTPAMERSGARMRDQFPGMDPDDVAREGLDNLANGPTWVAGEQNRSNYDLLRSLSRADAVDLLGGGARAIYDLPDDD